MKLHLWVLLFVSFSLLMYFRVSEITNLLLAILVLLKRWEPNKVSVQYQIFGISSQSCDFSRIGFNIRYQDWIGASDPDVLPAGRKRTCRGVQQRINVTRSLGWSFMRDQLSDYSAPSPEFTAAWIVAKRLLTFFSTFSPVWSYRAFSFQRIDNSFKRIS